MFKSSMHLLEDLHDHIKLLHTPERAQVGGGRDRGHEGRGPGSVRVPAPSGARLEPPTPANSSRRPRVGPPFQVLLAAAQNPLLGEHHFAKALLPRLCALVLAAPKATRHLLVKWWSDYPGQLLESRVVAPLQVRRPGRGAAGSFLATAAGRRSPGAKHLASGSQLVPTPE
jgi:hypothetical protein